MPSPGALARRVPDDCVIHSSDVDATLQYLAADQVIDISETDYGNLVQKIKATFHHDNARLFL